MADMRPVITTAVVATVVSIIAGIVLVWVLSTADAAARDGCPGSSAAYYSQDAKGVVLADECLP